MSLVSARRTHQGLSGRCLRGSLEQLRVTRLLNVEHRGSSHHYTSCSIGGTVRACQGHGSSKKLEACEDCTSCINDGTSSARHKHTGRVKARGVRRLHKLHQRWYEKCAPGAHGSSKGSWRAMIAQAASTTVQVVRTRSTRVE